MNPEVNIRLSLLSLAKIDVEGAPAAAGRSPGSEPRREEYEQVISLGAWCQVSEQLRRHRINAVSSPFDWLVTPFESIGSLISDNGKNLVKTVTPGHGGKSALCSHYGVLYHHEFERIAENLVLFDIETFETSRAKLLHKMENFTKACMSGRRTLFVRLGGHSIPPGAFPYGPESKPFPTSRIGALADLIAQSYPGLPFHILFFCFSETTSVAVDADHDRRFTVREIQLPTAPLFWEGDDSAWSRLFMDFGFCGLDSI